MSSHETSALRLLRLEEVLEITGLTRPSLYRFIALGHFPAPLQVGSRMSRWRSDDISAWIETRPVGCGAPVRKPEAVHA